MRKYVGLVIAVALTGCATSTGIVATGKDTYMLGDQGGMFDYTGSQVKAKLYGEAAKFCASKGMGMSPLASSGQDSSMLQYASAEVQFQCVKAGS
ncbi:hypothetical protein VSR17_16865 [Cupriavidus taiwanensis]|uniref:hypothetical protein n=1 Tax=Cupriavidus taiwanensis TaxID=164546 RepID=UPI000E1AE94C|nr:hypothetical protein [Cupriavidus taiwanensis]SOY48749.1 conserved exported hypothetical protein [Cupriavidus taiwanensis]SOZ23169.1 conserved exported hypothetical protein [Cupriavidus taiwanensis]SPA45062.1 conserved exported hypothetical protein [Cupriavidus taiwanensis]